MPDAPHPPRKCARAACRNEATVTYGLLDYCADCLPDIISNRIKMIAEVREREKNRSRPSAVSVERDIPRHYPGIIDVDTHGRT